VGSRSIEVVTEQVSAAAGRTGRVSGDLGAAADLAGASAGAAQGTSAADAYDALCSNFWHAVTGYAQAADHLAAALTVAAECYEAADRLPERP
jgi:uncharacterized protein YukE